MLNVQTEHLENHTARLTVTVDPEQINRAMRQAAQQIGKKARIPGFRPGKAPFNVIVTMFGYDYVLGEALEKIGNDLYREALEGSQVEPYAPGSLEEVQEGGQKLVFLVPKQPTVDLGDYRSVRVEHEPIEVTDEMLERALEQMRDREAVVEEVERPARYGDQVRLSHVEVLLVPLEDEEDEDDDDEDDDEEQEDRDEIEQEDEDDEEDDLDDDDDDNDDDDEDDEYDEDLDDDGEVVFHEHNYDYVLYEDPEKEELFPGFAAELVDAVKGDELVFELQVPEDFRDKEIAGRTLACEAHIEQVFARTVPEWTDELAKRISEDKSETLLDLRINTRKSLEETATNMADRDVALKALDKIVEGATIKYPEELVQDYITDFVETLEQNIKRQGLALQDWMRITGQTEADVREQYRVAATARAERALVLSELVRQEKLTVSTSDVDHEIDQMTQAFGGGEQGEQFRQFFSSPQSRMNIHTDLLTDRAMKQLAAIAKGENPPVGTADEVEPAAAEAEAAVSEDQPAPAAEVAAPAEASTDTPAESGESVAPSEEPAAPSGEATE